MKPLSQRELRALRHIRRVIQHNGRGPTTRELAELVGKRSSRTGALLIQGLAEKGYLRRREDGGLRLLKEIPDDRGSERTVLVPLVGSVPCGSPLLAEENLEAVIPVSTRIARGEHRYFLLRAVGDSMDLAGINQGDLVLVRQQRTAQSGDRIVALIDDEATIKEFSRAGDVITLDPRSTNTKHKPIVLDANFQIQGVVIATVQARMEAKVRR